MITGGKPARNGRVNSMKIEAHEEVKMVALYKGPRPKGGLKPVDVNRLYHVTCIVSYRNRDRARHIYDPASGLCKPAGVNLCI